MMEKVICILVLYKPSYEVLKCAINSVVLQVDLLYISDNTPDGYSEIHNIIKNYEHKTIYNLMNGNVGIAKAQNVAIKYAIENNYDYIYFLDQDSISPDGIVNGLKTEMILLESNGIKVGGVGPQPFNRDTGKPYLPNIKKGRFIKENAREVTEINSSASFVRTKFFETVGLMDELLFIDNVDQEICWRSFYLRRYRFFIISSLLLSHKLGEGDRHFLGISIKISTPFRSYYVYRNYFHLIRRSYVPLYWKFSHGVKLFCKYFYYCALCDQRAQYFKRMNMGIISGILNKSI